MRSLKLSIRYVWMLLLAGCLCAGNVYATIFGVKSCGSSPPTCAFVASAPPSALFSFAESGALFTLIGTVQRAGQGIDVDGLVLSPTHGLRGFERQPAGSHLLTINPTTAEATAVGALLSGRDIRGAVFDQSNTLWVLDAASDVVLRVDATTGAVIGTPVELTLSGRPFDLPDAADIAVRGGWGLRHYGSRGDIHLGCPERYPHVGAYGCRASAGGSNLCTQRSTVCPLRL